MPAAEPATPVTAVEIPEPWRGWVFGEMLPWARGNAQAREKTAAWCADHLVK